MEMIITMTSQHWLGIILSLVGIISTVTIFVINDIKSQIKTVDERSIKADQRSQEIETNYNAKFRNLEVNLLKELAETRHTILNAMQKFTEKREEDKEHFVQNYPSKSYCEMVHGNTERRLTQLESK